MRSFLKAVSKDEALIAKVGQMDKEALIALAKELARIIPMCGINDSENMEKDIANNLL